MPAPSPRAPLCIMNIDAEASRLGWPTDLLYLGPTIDHDEHKQADDMRPLIPPPPPVLSPAKVNKVANPPRKKCVRMMEFTTLRTFDGESMPSEYTTHEALPLHPEDHISRKQKSPPRREERLKLGQYRTCQVDASSLPISNDSDDPRTCSRHKCLLKLVDEARQKIRRVEIEARIGSDEGTQLKVIHAAKKVVNILMEIAMEAKPEVLDSCVKVKDKEALEMMVRAVVEFVTMGELMQGLKTVFKRRVALAVEVLKGTGRLEGPDGL